MVDFASLGELAVSLAVLASGLYLIRKGSIKAPHLPKQLAKKPDVPLQPKKLEGVQPKEVQSKPETSKLQNGRVKLSDIAEKSLAFLSGKKEEELEVTPT